MHILPVMELDELPELPADYVPSPWALRMAAELERRWKRGQKLVLVKLYDPPTFRTVGPPETY